ncbi:2-amino-4-hydroxy-6-hydroxymethyldihydropteridine diphosphokinase [Longilinea arvoryzae]|uniref:2-amino-4-hydroxy-6-hydroxymethyldihydropteridine diphosphokinase n=1 Tax=Longilinea arvoryzae TaxID=360412 RepID=A0A0S7BN22_9CHLR|nr:2-amino-4-hydroxy-6-hydroxymethyldihydropteridine diphosphokinase [Longilinea arvoryzae]GAP15403.1 2-amino-4-hydroxy-6-hydroxymethyldihydropteridine diphosphokinase [Longilinea arvoryzae]
MTETIFLALGTNLGDRVENLRAALEALLAVVEIKRVSPVYETPPWGVTDQPAFLNMVLQAETELDPPGLLRALKDMEVRLGRRPNVRYGPRLIDLDILFYGRQVVELENLSIPHPRLPERAFVLVPLAAVAPDLRHPVLHKTISELLAAVDASEIQPFEAVVYAPKIEPAGPAGGSALIHLPPFSPAALGKGRKPVSANLNGYVFRSSVFPENRVRQYLVINAQMRSAASLAQGQVIAASLVPDREPRSVSLPADLVQALAAESAAQARFSALALSHQREYVNWIEAAKRPETRARRIAETLHKLLA